MQHNRAPQFPSLETDSQQNADAYFLMDGNGRIVFATREAELLKDLPLPEYIWDLFPDCLPAVDAAFAACLANGQSHCQLTLPGPVGPARSVAGGFALCTFPAGTYQVLLALQPAAAQAACRPEPAFPSRTAFQQLDPHFIPSQTLAQIGNQYYKSLFEYHPDPVYSLDLEGHFLTANQQVNQLLGYEAGTILGQHFREVIVPEFLPDALTQFYLALQGQSRNYITAVHGNGGKQVVLDVTNIPILVNGQVTGIFGIAKDITHLQRSREERRQLIEGLEQKNHHLEQFAYIVSHNLRAPVANILGLTNLFNSVNPASDINQEVIANLQKSAESLDAIIYGLNQILSNRLGPDQVREMIDLSALVTSIHNTLKEDIIRNQVQIETDFREVAGIKTVKSYLHNIIFSLIRQAINHQDSSKQLAIKIKTTRFEDKICLTIQDNSLNLNHQKPGVPLPIRRWENQGDEKKLLFQLIRTQVETLGGKVEMETTPGSGATFKLYMVN